MSLPRRVPIRMTESEYQRWLLVADGAPLATWARVVVNTHVREVLGSFGEGDAANAAPSAPSPEERLAQVEEEIWGKPLIETLTDEPVTDDPEPYVPAPLIDEPPFNPQCAMAHLHWTVTRGDTCTICGGVAR